MRDLICNDARLLLYWDFELNNAEGLSAERLSLGSNKKAHWICEKGHRWTDYIYKMDHKRRCPICNNKRVLIGYNDLETLFPNLAKEWDHDINVGIDMLNIVPGSNKRVGWKCSECGCKWTASIQNRTTRGTGCPECAKTKITIKRKATLLEKSGSIADLPLAEEWDYTQNGERIPAQFTRGSGAIVWWKCKTCGHSWRAKITNRAVLNRGCPCCANKTVVKGINDLLTTNPDLAKEWDYASNGGLTPEQVTRGSGKKVWWICPQGHHYRASVLHRGHGTNCPVCNSGRQTSFAEQALFYYVKKIYPDAINRCQDILPERMELDIYIPSIRLAIEYDGIFWHHNKREREERKYKHCRELGIKLIRVTERFGTNTWGTADRAYSTPNSDDRKNLEKLIRLILDDLDPNSNFWTRKKPTAFHSCIAVDLDRDRFEIQKNLRVLERESLAAQYPNIASEWDTEKNGDVTPEKLKSKSEFKAWWKCNVCGHSWQTTVAHRVDGTGCPVCYRSSLSENHPNNKKIYQYSLQGEFIREWKSIAEAKRQLGINSSNISMCAKHKRPSAGGYRWEYELLSLK